MCKIVVIGKLRNSNEIYKYLKDLIDNDNVIYPIKKNKPKEVIKAEYVKFIYEADLILVYGTVGDDSLEEIELAKKFNKPIFYNKDVIENKPIFYNKDVIENKKNN